MAARTGPVPKRSGEKHGHISKAERAAVDTSARATGVDWPAATPEWHPIAREWFDSLGKSGQAAYFEPSDVATARYVASAMSENLLADKFSAMLFASVISASAELLATEGSRRRLRVELEQATQEDPAKTAAVSSLAAARARMEQRPG